MNLFASSSIRSCTAWPFDLVIRCLIEELLGGGSNWFENAWHFKYMKGEYLHVTSFL
jgi:hypothetical protein